MSEKQLKYGSVELALADLPIDIQAELAAAKLAGCKVKFEWYSSIHSIPWIKSWVNGETGRQQDRYLELIEFTPAGERLWLMLG